METIPWDLDGVISLPSSLSQLARENSVWGPICAYTKTWISSRVLQNRRESWKPGLQGSFGPLFSLMNLLHPNPSWISGVPYQVYAFLSTAQKKEGHVCFPHYAYFLPCYYFHSTKKDMMGPCGPKVIQLSGFTRCLGCGVIKSYHMWEISSPGYTAPSSTVSFQRLLGNGLEILWS